MTQENNAGWYFNVETGKRQYWDGQVWLSIPEPENQSNDSTKKVKKVRSSNHRILNLKSTQARIFVIAFLVIIGLTGYFLSPASPLKKELSYECAQRDGLLQAGFVGWDSKLDALNFLTSSVAKIDWQSRSFTSEFKTDLQAYMMISSTFGGPISRLSQSLLNIKNCNGNPDYLVLAQSFRIDINFVRDAIETTNNDDPTNFLRWAGDAQAIVDKIPRARKSYSELNKLIQSQRP